MRGKMLLDTIGPECWTGLPLKSPTLHGCFQARVADIKSAGSVVEITFPGLVTPEEERLRMNRIGTPQKELPAILREFVGP